MTTLKPTHPLTQTLCFLLAIGCSSHVEVAKGTGGTSGVDGGLCCDTPPTCDNPADIPYDPSSSAGGSPGYQFTGHPTYYLKSSCCKSIYCIRTDLPLAGGTTSTNGGSTSTDSCCTTPPRCDSPTDIVWNSLIPPETTTGSVYPYYMRTSCCTSILCLITTGAGGASGTGGSTGMETGGRVGSSTGGAPGTGGTMPYYGYPKANCSPGANGSCNDLLSVSSIWGTCDEFGYCVCNSGYYPSPTTGKCTTFEGSVCYSPTQNIDKAYVDRAIGCSCVSATDKPWCGIDSSGLRVYMSCSSSNKWQSGDTSSCN